MALCDRVCRRKLRAHLVRQCAEHGVKFLAGEVVDIEGKLEDEEVRITLDDGSKITSRCAACSASMWQTLPVL